MSPSPTARRRTSRTSGGSAAKKSRELFRTELEIPVKKLLTHREELDGARKIAKCVARLKRVLPRHPAGYGRYMARMEEITNGVATFFTWHPMKETIADDLKAVRTAYARAETQAPKSAKRTVTAFEKGVAVLLRYPLDPETLYQWSKEVAERSMTRNDLERHPRSRKAHRLLRRILEELDRERDRLVLPNLRLVLREVFRFPSKGMQESDLFQEGFLGLNKAVYRFDPLRNLRFSTYATHWIRQSIRKALIDKSSMIRLPQALHEKLYRHQADASDADREEADRIRRLRGNTVLFSAMAVEDEDSPFDVKDQKCHDIGPELQTREIPRAVAKALRRLSDAEREVVERRFGLHGSPRQTLEEVGSQMNLSRERIRQIERGALEQLREARDLHETYEDLSLVEASTAS